MTRFVACLRWKALVEYELEDSVNSMFGRVAAFAITAVMQVGAVTLAYRPNSDSARGSRWTAPVPRRLCARTFGGSPR